MITWRFTMPLPPVSEYIRSLVVISRRVVVWYTARKTSKQLTSYPSEQHRLVTMASSCTPLPAFWLLCCSKQDNLSNLNSFIRSRSTDTGFYTGTHWRCSRTLEDNWFKRNFDDSDWSNAVVPAFYFTYFNYEFLSNFYNGSRMIWHYDFSLSGTVYCRGRLGYRKSKIVTNIVRVHVDMYMYM